MYCFNHLQVIGSTVLWQKYFYIVVQPSPHPSLGLFIFSKQNYLRNTYSPFFPPPDPDNRFFIFCPCDSDYSRYLK